ncbi:DUF2264 domain-containing protein [Arthrobacter sp.]|uniref:DUF2264 domain-containing protein n=1 Tax=Arthrobacter sp. TaxID=1667 RepID=UPI00258473DA|nr:DUF2264 domain-containing protein [Arthrobacter sp.]
MNGQVNDDAAQRRAYWFGFADRQLLAVRPCFSPGHALLRLPGRPAFSGVRSDELEGFARTFLLAALRVAGSGGDDPHGHLDWYRPGLVAGAARWTDEGADAARAAGKVADESWNPVVSRTQALVEAASVAIGLQLTRPWLWDRLDLQEQDTVASWLQGAGTADPWDNNWVLFNAHVAEFLAGVGRDHNPDHITAALDRIEDWSVGGGWYRDGDNGGTGDFFDYYCGWALHLYPLLWCRFAAARAVGGPHPWAADRLPLYRERLSEFLRTYPAFFGGGGEPVFHGRSLTYRFAAAAPLALGALFLEPGDPGGDAESLARAGTLATATLRYFDTPEAFPEGIACLGWQGPYEPMIQNYSGPGSPYWSSKAFLALLLPEGSPFWSTPAETTPARPDETTLIPGPGFLLHRGPDGIAQLANHGSDKHYGPTSDNALYSRFAYSSHTGPLRLPGQGLGSGTDPVPSEAVDNHLAVLDAAGRASWRSRIHRLETCPGTVPGATAASFHRPVWTVTEDEAEQPLTVATGTTARGGYQLRVHRVQLPAGPAGQYDGWSVREGGWAVTPGVHATLWPLTQGTLVQGPHAQGSAAVVVGEMQGTTAFGEARCPTATTSLSAATPLLASVHHLGLEAPGHRPGPFTLTESGGWVRASVRMLPLQDEEGEPFTLGLEFRTPGT